MCVEGGEHSVFKVPSRDLKQEHWQSRKRKVSRQMLGEALPAPLCIS